MVPICRSRNMPATCNSLVQKSSGGRLSTKVLPALAAIRWRGWSDFSSLLHVLNPLRELVPQYVLIDGS